MEIFLLFVIIGLAVAICVLAVVWFFHEPRERAQRKRAQTPAIPSAKPAGGRDAHYAWDGGVRTSPRQLR